MTPIKNCPAGERLAALFDGGAYTETDAGLSAGVITAYGYIGGIPAYAFSQDITDNEGAVGTLHGKKICRILELAAKNGVPVVGIYDSKGALIEEGTDALDAVSGILMEMGNISGVVPVISVIPGVCAGSMAVIASSADFSVITAKGELYMTANSASSPENAAENGAVSAYAPDEAEAFELVRRYISLMPQNNLSPVPEFEFEEPQKTAFDSGESAVLSIADEESVIELSKGFGTSCTALCTVGGVSAGIAAAVGKDKLTGEDCSKIAKLVRLCDAFGLPVITVIDSEGFADEGIGGVRACARVSGVYAEAVVPKIAVISGKACGAVFNAFAGKNVSADEVIALTGSVIAPIDPLTAAEFLYHDKLKGAADLASERKRLADEYAAKDGSPEAAAAKGTVNSVVSPENARAAVLAVLDIASGKRLSRRLPKKHSILPL